MPKWDVETAGQLLEEIVGEAQSGEPQFIVREDVVVAAVMDIDDYYQSR